MAKTVHNDILDAALNLLKNQVTHITCCSALPASYASAVGGDKLAWTTISAADFTGPEDGTSGRKITVGQKADVAVSATGDASVICLVDSSGSRILYTTLVSGSQTITDGNTMTFNTWAIQINDPT